MKKQFSNKWKGSKQPRKKRKYMAKAPQHIKIKFMGANLSKELRQKYGRRSVIVRQGDKVKVMRGGFKKKEGKVTNVFMKLGKITIEGIQRKKIDGSKVDIKISPSKVKIMDLNLDDKNRSKMFKKETNINQDKKEKMENKK